MIRVTLELVSARGEARDRLLGVAYLANTGKSGSPRGLGFDYTVWLSKTIPGRTDEAWKTGRAAITADDAALINEDPAGLVLGFDNVRRGAWDLLYLALQAVVGPRNRR